MNTEIAKLKNNLPSLKSESKKLTVHYGEENVVFARMQQEIAALQEHYLNLLETNSKLSAIISEQQRMLCAEQPAVNLLVPIPAETAISVKKEEEEAPQILHHGKLLECVRNVTGREKQQQLTLEGKTRMIELLYKNEEGMRPAELFSACGVKRGTGFKYVNFFQQRGVLWFAGNNWEGRYQLTDRGRKFAEGKEVELSSNKHRYNYNSRAMNKPKVV